MINARSETAAEKPSFRDSFRRQRCLIPVDGYYEWMTTPNGKQPYAIGRTDDRVMAVAGLWASNTKASSDGLSFDSCTILTTAANETTRPIHDRMPVLIREDDYQRWLDPGLEDPAVLDSLIQSAAETMLKVRPVSRYVNSARHEGPRCLDAPPPQTDLLF